MICLEMISLDSNVIFIIGLVIAGASVLVTVAVAPVFFFMRSALKKKLNEDYGKHRNKKK